MSSFPYVADHTFVSDAAELIATFGTGAAFEAASRAGRSRDLGNHLHFCRWRQIERLIDVLHQRSPIGAIH